MVGAPQAWAVGYDGTGVTVVVLDTGIDDSHPDLAGKVVGARNFTSEPDTTDLHGEQSRRGEDQYRTGGLDDPHGVGAYRRGGDLL